MIYKDMDFHFWRKEFKEKRKYKRLETNLYVQFFHDDSLYDGLVTDLSEIGIGFITGAYFTPGLILMMHTPQREEVLNVPVKISRAVKTGSLYDDFGAEVLNPPPNFLDFVGSLRSSL
jgi:hypothetical protein